MDCQNPYLIGDIYLPDNSGSVFTDQGVHKAHLENTFSQIRSEALVINMETFEMTFELDNSKAFHDLKWDKNRGADIDIKELMSTNIMFPLFDQRIVKQTLDSNSAINYLKKNKKNYTCIGWEQVGDQMLFSAMKRSLNEEGNIQFELNTGFNNNLIEYMFSEVANALLKKLNNKLYLAFANYAFNHTNIHDMAMKSQAMQLFVALQDALWAADLTQLMRAMKGIVGIITLRHYLGGVKNHITKNNEHAFQVGRARWKEDYLKLQEDLYEKLIERYPDAVNNKRALENYQRKISPEAIQREQNKIWGHDNHDEEYSRRFENTGFNNMDHLPQYRERGYVQELDITPIHQGSDTARDQEQHGHGNHLRQRGWATQRGNSTTHGDGENSLEQENIELLEQKRIDNDKTREQLKKKYIDTTRQNENKNDDRARIRGLIEKQRNIANAQRIDKENTERYVQKQKQIKFEQNKLKIEREEWTRNENRKKERDRRSQSKQSTQANHSAKNGGNKFSVLSEESEQERLKKEAEKRRVEEANQRKQEDASLWDDDDDITPPVTKTIIPKYDASLNEINVKKDWHDFIDSYIECIKNDEEDTFNWNSDKWHPLLNNKKRQAFKRRIENDSSFKEDIRAQSQKELSERHYITDPYNFDISKDAFQEPLQTKKDKPKTKKEMEEETKEAEEWIEFIDFFMKTKNDNKVNVVKGRHGMNIKLKEAFEHRYNNDPNFAESLKSQTEYYQRSSTIKDAIFTSINPYDFKITDREAPASYDMDAVVP